MSHLPWILDTPLIAMVIAWIGYMAWLALTEGPPRLVLAVLGVGSAIVGGLTLIAVSPAGPMIAGAWAALPQLVRLAIQASVSLLPSIYSLWRGWRGSARKTEPASGPPLFLR